MSDVGQREIRTQRRVFAFFQEALGYPRPVVGYGWQHRCTWTRLCRAADRADG